ncbi:MAG: glycosyltransferase, partial [Planctomycetota bacterium]
DVGRRRAADARGLRAGERRMMRPRIAFVVNGGPGSAMDVRARAFAERLSDTYDVRILHRGRWKVLSLAALFLRLLALRPAAAWVLDVAYSGVLATWLASILARFEWVIDTGDPIVELARSMGRGRVGLALTSLLERIALGRASHVVVRGTFHEEWLRGRGWQNVTTIQDGVDAVAVAAGSGAGAREKTRAELGLGGDLVLGVVGSLSWSERLGIGYGWDLVETLGLLRDLPVKGLIVGDGPGAERLRRRAAELGVAERLVFTGRVPYERLPALLAAMDVALSTQTDDLVGRFRTTGKLPLYLAAGRFILTSDVGEAKLVLPEASRVPYAGTVDRSYPGKLAERVRPLVADRARLGEGAVGAAIAAERFDYSVLASRASGVLAAMTRIRGPFG